MAKNASETSNVLRVVTGPVRLSFPYLFTPRPSPDGKGDPKYSVMLLIPKTDKETIDALRAAEAEATRVGITTKFEGKKAGLSPSIIKDADEDGTAEDYPEREGHLYMTVNATEQFKPEVVDRGLNPVTSQSEVYSGVWARVSVSAFPYKRDVKKGVSFGLNNVQVLGYGDSLAGGKRADQEFEALSDEDEALL